LFLKQLKESFPLDAKHKISPAASLFESVSLIPEGDEIVVDIIAASFDSIRKFVYDLPIRHFTESQYSTTILQTIRKVAGKNRGIGSDLNAHRSGF
jgi:hypothetical protein